MIDAATVEEYMRDANPIPAPEDVDADEFASFVAVVQARRAAVMHAPTRHPTRSTPTARQTELGGAGAPVAKREESTMVTHQQPDIETPTPTPTTPPPKGRGPLMAAAVAVVVILAGVGIAFATGALDSDADVAAEPLAVATQLMDDFNDGWNANDPEAIAAVFTEDGTFIDIRGISASGQDELMGYLEYRVDGVTDVERTEELTATGNDTFTVPVKFKVDSVGNTYTYLVINEIELKGDLAYRIQHMEVVESGTEG